MKLIIVILLLTQLCFAADLSNKNIEIQNFNEKILSQTYELTLLKTAHFLNKIGLKTIEEYAADRFSDLSDEELALYKKKFTQFALSDSYNSFIRIVQRGNYWNIKKRFENSTSALILVFINNFEEKIFTEEEITLLWIMHHADQLESNQKIQFNFSANVANLTGAKKNKRRMNYDTAENLIAKMSKYKEALSIDSITALSNQFYTHPEELQFTDNKIFFQHKLVLNLPVYTPETIASTYPKELKDDRDELQGNMFFKRNFITGISAIHQYHQLYNDQNYAIIDKTNKTISLFNQGQLLSIQPLATPLSLDDRKNIGGAGIYFIEGRHNLYNENLSFFDELKLDLDLDDGLKIYILPTNYEEHDFVINNYKISFNALIKKKNYQSFNYSGRDNYFIKTNFKITKNYTYFKYAFMNSLENEKSTLMKLYNMDSDTFNQLARFSYGVLAAESKFGESKKYQIKEALPVVISIIKGNGLDQSQNSQGPTQIKTIPQKIVDYYHFEKSDLENPRTAAVATLAFSYEILQDLKRIAHFHKDINNQNLYDYLYKIYQGKRSEITKGTAKLEISNDPEKKTKFQIMTEAYQELTIIDSL